MWALISLAETFKSCVYCGVTEWNGSEYQYRNIWKHFWIHDLEMTWRLEGDFILLLWSSEARVLNQLSLKQEAKCCLRQRFLLWSQFRKQNMIIICCDIMLNFSSLPLASPKPEIFGKLGKWNPQTACSWSEKYKENFVTKNKDVIRMNCLFNMEDRDSFISSASDELSFSCAWQCLNVSSWLWL